MTTSAKPAQNTRYRVSLDDAIAALQDLRREIGGDAELLIQPRHGYVCAPKIETARFAAGNAAPKLVSRQGVMGVLISPVG